MSGVRSRSTQRGGIENFNEIRLEDKKGGEQVIIHAEKDILQSVGKDMKEYVGQDRHLKVVCNQMELVGGDKHST